MMTFGTGAGAYPYRFNWSAPLYISPHDPNVLYFGGNVLFKTTDGGTSWSVVSPDLGQPCDASRLGRSGGPISSDDTNAEAYCTIYAISEDAADPQTLWVGTDDGNLWVTRDGGAHWTNVEARVPHLPANAEISSIDASRTTPGVAYVSFDRHALGDPRPYVYDTTDYGQTWNDISRGLPSYVHVVREDPRQTNLLFAGTEQGISASFDRGRHWIGLMLGMPAVPVYDAKIQPVFDDLILGTHGRGFYVLDDLTPLEQIAEAPAGNPALFAPMPAYRYEPRPTYEPGRGAFVSDNKSYGAVISYYLPARPRKARAPKVTLRIFDAKGGLVRTLDATTSAGINRVAWDLDADPPGGKGAVQDPRDFYVFYPLEISGPEVLPGTYTIQLHVQLHARPTVNDFSFEAPLEVPLDPEAHASASGLQAQYDALERLAQLQERGEIELSVIATLDAQIAARRRHAGDAPLSRALSAYGRDLDAAADALRNGNGSQNSGYKHAAALVDQIAYLRHLLPLYLGPPTQAQQALIDRYATQSDQVDARTKALFTTGLAAMNAQLTRAKLAPLRTKVPSATHRRARSAPPD